MAGPEWIAGVDEAGRGSVVGPLVVGAFCIPADRAGALSAAGARDSKLLSASRREAVYATLRTLGEMRSVSLAPATIDRWVRQGRLNDLEARAFARVLGDRSFSTVYVDACDPVPRRFAAMVARHLRTAGRIVALHHADRDIPVVGAASIVAKVRRDRAIARIRDRFGATLGSGYPSDGRTVAWLGLLAGPDDPARSAVRASWATLRRLNAGPAARTLEEFAR